MAVTYAVLQQPEQKETVTPESHPAFFYHLQQALLLALQEQGILRTSEYRRAEEMLSRKYTGRTRGDDA